MPKSWPILKRPATVAPLHIMWTKFASKTKTAITTWRLLEATGIVALTVAAGGVCGAAMVVEVDRCMLFVDRGGRYDGYDIGATRRSRYDEDVSYWCVLHPGCVVD